MAAITVLVFVLLYFRPGWHTKALGVLGAEWVLYAIALSAVADPWGVILLIMLGGGLLMLGVSVARFRRGPTDTA